MGRVVFQVRRTHRPLCKIPRQIERRGHSLRLPGIYDENDARHILSLRICKMRLDQDSRDATYQGMSNRADMLYVKYVTATSFITPEISEFSMDRLNELQRSKRFKDYDVFFKEIIRNKDIILSKKEENCSAKWDFSRTTQGKCFLCSTMRT